MSGGGLGLGGYGVGWGPGVFGGGGSRVFGADSGFRVGWRWGGRGWGLVSICGEFSAGVGEAFILGAGLGAGLSLYGV